MYSINNLVTDLAYAIRDEPLHGRSVMGLPL